MPLIPVKTGDGSQTLFDTEKNIYFRSEQGAFTESAYVFYESSKIAQCVAPRHVLELGLGTGLNFLVTADRLLKEDPQRPLHYHVVEVSPLHPEQFLGLQHHNWLQEPQLETLLHQALIALQEEAKNEHNQSCESIHLHLYRGLWQDIELPTSLRVQAIYHDPFGPKENPDCWTEECFRWSTQHLSPNGRLVTYAAATQMRRNMVAAGLYIASLPGSGRKREMTLAAFQEEALEGAKILRQARFYL